MRTCFTVLLLGCGFASVLVTPAAAQTSGVVFVGDMQSVDKAVLEAAELPLPSVNGPSAKKPRLDRRVTPTGTLPPAAASRVVPTGFNAAASPAAKAKPTKPSFFGRMKPTWLFGKSEEAKEPAQDPFAQASQKARIELTGAATKPRSGVKPIPSFVEKSKPTPSPAYGRPTVTTPRPAMKRGGGIAQRPNTTPQRGLLTGLFSTSDKVPASSTPALVKAHGSKSGFAMAASTPGARTASSNRPQMLSNKQLTAPKPAPPSRPAPVKLAAASKPLAPKPPRAAKSTGVATKVIAPRKIANPKYDEPTDAAVFASDEKSQKVTAPKKPTTEPAVVLPKETVVADKPEAPMPPKLVPAYVEVPSVTKPVVEPQSVVAAATPSNAKPVVLPKPQAEETGGSYATDVYSTNDESPPVASSFDIPTAPYFATDRFERVDPRPTSTPKEPTQRSIDLLAEAHQIAAYAGTAKEFSTVVKHCRYVLAIDDSEQAQAYANQLAGWALTKRGDCFDDEGRQDEAEIDYREALRCDAECWRAEHALGVIASRKGNVAEAQQRFDRTLDVNPEFAKAYSNRAALAVHRGDYHAALSDFQTAIDIDPDLSAAHTGRGRVCHMLGMLDEGLRHLDAAELLDSDNALIASGRADLLVDLGRYGQAAEAYERAIQLDPNAPAPYRNLAWMQATCPVGAMRNGEAALANAEHAEQLSGHADDLTLDTKAAALATLGRFDEASDVQRQAIEIAPPADAAAYAERLAMYEQGEAFTAQPIAVRQASYTTAGGTY